MKIDTNDWLSMSEAVRSSGIPQKTFYSVARRLGVVVELFGVHCIRKRDVAKVVASRGVPGNPDWIKSQDAAGEAARRAVESRLRRIEREGLTEAELTRGERISAARRKP